MDLANTNDWLGDPVMVSEFERDASRAANDNNSLRYWRSRASIHAVVDTVYIPHARIYFEIADRLAHQEIAEAVTVLQNIDAALEASSTLDFGWIRLSPTMCRYLVRAVELQQLCGFTGQRVVEIGGGWGGLCAVVHALYRPAGYVIIDLPSILAAQRAALGLMGIQGVTCSTDSAELHGDLLISDYAFSELTEAAQEQYGQYFHAFPRGAMMCPPCMGTKLHSPAQMAARLARMSLAAVQWGPEIDHYLWTAREHGDVRLMDAYLWR